MSDDDSKPSNIPNSTVILSTGDNNGSGRHIQKGEVIYGYVVEQKLGQGGMGEAFKLVKPELAKVQAGKEHTEIPVDAEDVLFETVSMHTPGGKLSSFSEQKQELTGLSGATTIYDLENTTHLEERIGLQAEFTQGLKANVSDDKQKLTMEATLEHMRNNLGIDPESLDTVVLKTAFFPSSRDGIVDEKTRSDILRAYAEAQNQALPMRVEVPPGQDKSAVKEQAEWARRTIVIPLAQYTHIYPEGTRVDTLMEYVEVGRKQDGESKADFRWVSEDLTTQEIADIGIDVFFALEQAQRVGLIHRDIKPDNIFVGTDKHAKLADFGLVKNKDSIDVSLTQEGTIMGTPHYMSPAQANGQELDGRDDLYSVGVSLFHYLTGSVPHGGTLTQVLHGIAYEPTEKIGERFNRTKEGDPVSQGLAEVIYKMMQKDINARYQTPREAIEALAPYSSRYTHLVPAPDESAFLPTIAMQKEEMEQLTGTGELEKIHESPTEPDQRGGPHIPRADKRSRAARRAQPLPKKRPWGLVGGVAAGAILTAGLAFFAFGGKGNSPEEAKQEQPKVIVAKKEKPTQPRSTVRKVNLVAQYAQEKDAFMRDVFTPLHEAPDTSTSYNTIKARFQQQVNSFNGKLAALPEADRANLQLDYDALENQLSVRYHTKQQVDKGLASVREDFEALPDRMGIAYIRAKQSDLASKSLVFGNEVKNAVETALNDLDWSKKVALAYNGSEADLERMTSEAGKAYLTKLFGSAVDVRKQNGKLYMKGTFKGSGVVAFEMNGRGYTFDGSKARVDNLAASGRNEVIEQGQLTIDGEVSNIVVAQSLGDLPKYSLGGGERGDIMIARLPQ